MPGFGLGPWQLLAGGLADITLCSLLVYARCLALAGDPGGGSRGAGGLGHHPRPFVG